MDLGIKGLKALVTGSTRGLGYVTARVLASEGAIVCINGRDQGTVDKASTAISKETGQKAVGVAGDVSSAAACARLIDQSAAAMQGLDLLVTNAGGPPPGKFESLRR